MATSVTELILKFRGDSGDLKSTMAQVRAELTQNQAEITKQQKTEAASAASIQRQRSAALIAIWKADTRAAVSEEKQRAQAVLREEKQLSAQMIRESRAAQASRIQATRSVLQEEKQLAAQMIRESRAAQASRTQAERVVAADTRRFAREREQIMAQNARAIAGIARSEADARIREGRRAANAAIATVKGGTGGADFAAALGFGGGIAGGITALVGASAISEIRSAAAAWVNYSSKLESTKIAFTTMLGSAQLATAHLKELQAFAIKTPFQFEELIDASQRMQALGFEADQVLPILTDVGNAVAAAGGGAERLDRVVLALSQMQSKGKVATQEMNQLAEAGIPGWRILEQQLGRSRAELVKMVEQGQISSAVFLEAFQKFSQQNFGGLMEKQAKTFSGAMSNIKDATLLTASTALAPLFEKLTQTALEIGRIGGGLTEAASGLARLTSAVGVFAGAVSGLGNIPVPAIIQALLAVSGIQGLTKGLSLLGTPEIPPLPTGKAGQPVPLRSSEEFAEAEEASALRTQSEEAKRIATDRIAEQERLFKLGKLTREQETENIINQLRIRAAAEQGALTEESHRKLKEIQANRDNADKVKAIIEDVANLEQQIRNNQSALEREIADKRAALQLQERRNLLEHGEARAAIEIQAGQTIIAAIEAEVKAGIKSREEGAKLIEQIENAGFDRRARLLKLELSLAGVEPAERQKVNDKLAALDAERTANAQKQADRRREISAQENRDALALERQLAAIQEAVREGRLAAIQRARERGGVTESAALTAELEAFKAAHADRILLLDVELEQETTSAARKTEIINEKIALEQRYTDEVERLSQERIDAFLKEAFETGKAPGSAAREGQIFLGEEAAATIAGARASATAGRPPALNTDQIIAHATAVEGAFAGLGVAITETLGLSVQAGQIIGDTLAGAFGSLANAVGQAVHSFVLFGKVEGGFKRFAAEVIASLAASAAVQAVYQFAQGLAWLALNFFLPNPKYLAAAKFAFASAAVFGSIAGVAALAGRALAGNSFTDGGGQGGGGGTPSRADTRTTTEPKTIDVDRRSAVHSQPIVQTIEFRVKGGVIVDEFAQDYLLNGRTRVLIKSDGQA
jgi:tape measure domain-containing protein